MKKLLLICAEDPSELHKKAKKKGEMLSFAEAIEWRIKTANKVLAQLAKHSPILKGQLLTLALQEEDVWRHRITTCTQMVRAQGGYRFFEQDMPDTDFTDITDGGVRYTEIKGGVFIDEHTYDQNPGGAYPIEKFLAHPVFRAIVNNQDLVDQYGENLKLLSHARLNSPGFESIWCPQALPIGVGRSWALGMGADSAYPPNNTTKGHWTLVKT